MVTIKELADIEQKIPGIRPGNFACSGCGLNLSFRHAVAAVGGKAIISVPACCTSVIQGMGDGYGMDVPILNVAFAAAPAVASGIVSQLRREGKDDIVIAWAGDGGTSDIGVSSLSGAASRREDIIYINYDNSGYQNTGCQASSATTRGMITTTTPLGYTQAKKHMANIMISQGVPYVATTTPGFPTDLYEKVKRAADDFKGGFRFIQIDVPCPPGWRFDSRETVKVAKLAVETGLWPLYEYYDETVHLSRIGKRYRDPEKRKPIEDYLKLQGRFRRISPEMIEGLNKDIDRQWKFLETMMPE